MNLLGLGWQCLWNSLQRPPSARVPSLASLGASLPLERFPWLPLSLSPALDPLPPNIKRKERKRVEKGGNKNALSCALANRGGIAWIALQAPQQISTGSGSPRDRFRSSRGHGPIDLPDGRCFGLSGLDGVLLGAGPDHRGLGSGGAVGLAFRGWGHAGSHPSCYGQIQQKLEANAERLEKLSLEWASSNMPRLQQPMMSVDDMEPAAVISNLRGALRQLDELGSQRAGLEESLKAMKEKDNILPKLMASSSDHEALFDAEIAKYNPIRDQVTRNCSTQDQVLRDIAQNYNKFVTLFGVADWRSACSTAAADVRNAVGLYRELRDNLSEGARFYLQLQEVITSLSQHCGDFCLTRRIQRDDLVEELQRKNQQASQAEADRLAALRISLQPPVPHGGPAPPSGAAYPQLAGNA
eukprot:CAMPEP_0177627274 /NCGR_PEP_ID=MMETSP0419_2-20121207/31113_1 /TAXON_ID=582737 /ORGANISM="Tetraselmis sp., Strain GSL018" /LENGTH=411 /DNA_ID=CAMNT_0019128411 /DNA_START=56 /DNA_END=1287 /DNA_ORIENTATION=-